MFKIKESFISSLETAKKLKTMLYLVTIIYVVSYIAGYIIIQIETPAIMEFVEPIVDGISNNPVFIPIISALEKGNVAFAIAYTFSINLASGAFASTTLPGVIPLLGALITILVTGFRGFIIGIIFTLAASMISDVNGFGWRILALGTLILELGAYVFSATAGINISLSTIFPSRYQTESRWFAFKEAWKDAGRIYILVIILLALGAIWEMGGIYILTP
ncbi:hypothetical protein AC481_03245 [miscellaneous Crenarchaeota group archaeon SMTZ-80]|nr:MAG: hypothetical protein AC481_03245 [miscellaneous Crenarchaeota group archaeon SMTZ-80]